MNRRPAIAVLDGNLHWGRSLWTALAPFADVLLVTPLTFSQAMKTRSGDGFLLPRWKVISGAITEWQINLPPGWFSRGLRAFGPYVRRGIEEWFRERKPLVQIAVASYPQYFTILRRLRGTDLVYYWSDDFRSYWPAARNRIEQLEGEAIREASLVISASEAKTRDFREIKSDEPARIQTVIHGFNPSLPASSHSTAAVAHELRAFVRPWIGHWGNISHRIDFESVYAMATKRPDATFFFVGSVTDDFSNAERAWYEKVLRLPNYVFLGWRPYAAIGSYTPHFDVNLALYRPSVEACRIANPSKVRDYLASGPPILSTRLPDLVEFWPDALEYFSAPEEAMEKLEMVLAKRGAGREERLELARRNSWNAAGERVWAMLEEMVLSRERNLSQANKDFKIEARVE
ncbi:MAG: hypothetical protein L6R30_20550 [Thermoanaerobaculia bacterium]|nr:hypothetical protein [Thermoanaerobaculia bacterium]